MKTRSNIIKRLLSLALCICMVLALVPAINLTVNAADISGGTKAHLKPHANWKQANARFAAYFFNDSTGKNAWASMSDPDGNGIYTCEAPSGTWKNVIFCRMNPSNATNNWENKWNQTGNLTVPSTTNTLYTLTGGEWDGVTGSWSKPSCSDSGVHSYNASNVCSSCNKSKCAIDGGHKFNSSNVCSVCNTEGVIVYFQNDWLWTNVQLYYWNDKVNNGWPGEPMIKYDGAARSDSATAYDYYYMVIPKDFTNIIISGVNDKGEDVQSVDIPASTYFDGVTYCMFWDDSLTVNKNSYKTFAICEDFPAEHKIGADNKCSRCDKSYCNIYDHEFDASDNKCVNCGLLSCHAYGHHFNGVDICEICGTELIWVFFDNHWGWTNIHLYYWYDNAPIPVEWPGVKMNLWKSSSGSNSYSYYKVQIPADVDHFVINGINDKKEEDQTPDLDGNILYNGITFRMLWVEGVGNQVEEPYDMDDKFACAADHAYGETQYVWADDYSSCTATRTCTVCNGKESGGIQSIVDDNVASWQVSAGTCVAQEQVGYEVYFDLIFWAKHQEVIITLEKDPNNHVDREAIYVDNGDGTHTQKWLCCGVAIVEGEDHADADKSGRCDSCSALMVPAALRKASVSLKGNIAVNYYMLMSEKLLSDETAYMQFTMANGEIRKVPASEGVKLDYEGETYYVYSCEVSAKEMTDTIISQFFYDNTATEKHLYSVRTYAEHILKSDKCTDAHNLIRAMVNYGAASQLHFNYKTDDLANSFLTEQPDYSTVTVPDTFKPIPNQGTAQTKLYSVSLVLKSETTLRFFFQGKVTEAAYNGQKLNVFQRNGLYCVDVTDIAAKDLDDEITITINDGSETASVTCSAMTYCWIVQIDDSGAFDAAMKDLASALYLYNQAANAYFKESN